MRVVDAIRRAEGRLRRVSDTPRLDAETLMANALGLTREQMLLSASSGAAPFGYDSLVERRLRHEPVAYIVGRRAFWTIDLEVGPGALVPRPDSETLIEAAIAAYAGRSPQFILDLGTGPGTLLLAALDHWPRARGLGIDRSAEALVYARRNALRLGIDRAEFRLGDWTEGVDRRFDLILCNPPYVEASAVLPRDVADWEPASALYAGADGLDAYRRLATGLGPCLAPGGWVCLEIGMGQAQAVSDLFAGCGFCVSTRLDLAGVPRCLILRLDRD